MRKKNHSELSLQDIARTFGISYQTLNYYTSLGLIRARRRQGNKRLYGTADIRKRLAKIDKLKNEGYPLRIICKIINGRGGAV